MKKRKNNMRLSINGMSGGSMFSGMRDYANDVLMPILIPENIISEGKTLGEIILKNSGSPEIAYAMCTVALARIRTDIKKSSESRRILNEIKMQFSKVANGDEFNKRLDSIGKNVDMSKSMDNAVKQLYSQPIVDAYNEEIERLKKTIYEMQKEKGALIAMYNGAKLSLKAEKENAQKIRNHYQNEVDKLTKENMDLDHRLNEMEKALQYSQTDYSMI